MSLKGNYVMKGKKTTNGNVRYNFIKLTPGQAILQHTINMIDLSSPLVFSL